MSTMPSVEDASRCIKCGFCMNSCPIYVTDHLESHVARGRNMLIRWANDSSIPEDDAYRERLSYCILCGRCEAVCPARVPSVDINIAARTEMVNKKGLSWIQRLLYRGLLKNRPLMAKLLGIASRIPGLSAKEGRPLRHMADSLHILSGDLYIPKLSRPALSKRLPEVTPSAEGVPKRGRVAVFPGCSFEFFFADIGERIVNALSAAGYEVVYPSGLTCCGLAVRGAGDLATARLMAQQNMEILEPFDRIITGCATCYSAFKDYEKWFAGDEKWQQKAKELSARVSDFATFMANEGIKPQPVEEITVTYHDPCHMRWHHGLFQEPRQLLRSIKGVKYVEMEGAEDCCGLGGAFGISHRDTSLEIQERKMKSIKKTGVQVVVTSCPGCIIQLRDGARRHGLDIEVMHISELIDGQKGQPRKRRSTGDAAEQSPHP